MKHPIWILNSTLALLLIFAFGFMILAWKKAPAREDIEPNTVAMPLKDEMVKVNIHNIYENDLFGTYKQEIPTLLPGDVAPMPPPPTAKAVSIPPLPVTQFLDPLNITLKGIIILLDDDSNNRAIISDNTTSKEVTYRVGQAIQDAQIIRVLSNKVIILRSNGQQEVLYLREKDAKMDPAYTAQSDWHDVIKKVSDTQFEINAREFVARVKNLAQFIEMLDLITVYRQGKSIGCTIGSSASSTLGTELGLQRNDTITNINGIAATTTAERFKIYKDIIAMQTNNTINVTLLRHQQEVTLHYTIKDFKGVVAQGDGTSGQPAATASKDLSADQLREKQTQSLRQQQRLAPTLQEIRAKERANMLQNGKDSTATSVTGKVE